MVAADRRDRLLNVPLLPLRGALVFPGLVVPLNVGRPRSIAAIEQAMLEDRRLVLATQKDAKIEEPKPQEIYSVGTIATIKQMNKATDGTIRIVTEGTSRCRILRYTQEQPYLRVVVEEIQVAEEKSVETEALMKTVIHQYERYIKLSKKLPPDAVLSVISVEEPGRLADAIAAHLLSRTEDKQEVLEAIPPKERLEKVSSILTRETELLELERRINVRVRKQIEKTQKEYYLREQLRAIQKELGEGDDRASEAEEYRTKVEEAQLPKEVEEKVLKEVDRLEKMPPMAAEAVVVRNYIDWILSLPWNKETEDRLDINDAERILEEDHYGLKRVKERIVEFLAVRQLVHTMKGPILCLIGPPGVGKTSLAKSVARALGRNFVRISLGGMRDEAEIRGHRRTYVGALPGRIIHGMRQAGSRNPVFLLDEVDKIGTDFRGDPASALLEVLDPEQNSNFSDHYIEMPFDLSKVLFITTANAGQTIPRALLDRMEAIHIPGYTEEEKVQIVRRHLLPKQIREHGLDNAKLAMSDPVLRKIIREYTREAGVRNVERELSSICRKVATEVVRNGSGRYGGKVTVRNLHRFLGPPRFRFGSAEKEDEVGVAMGIGWTETGGDIMPIEVSVVKGKGELVLTGSLGDVMKESARAAFSYVRSRAPRFGIDEAFHEKYDIHIHVPEGALPKEGPSAGITMAVALLSALSRIPVRCDVAMTGEITLRGKVLPIGGVKEKVLAAHRAGINRVVLPVENSKDLEEIPASVRKKVEFILVDHMDEVLEASLALRQAQVRTHDLELANV